jgi:hypothetical protein
MIILALIGWTVTITADASPQDLEIIASKFARQNLLSKGHCVSVEFSDHATSICRGDKGHPYYKIRYFNVHDIELLSCGPDDEHFK